MAQVIKKFIADDAIADEKIRLDNNANLKARNAADSGNVNILKVNASDVIEFASVPQVTADPVANNDLARKSYVDTVVGSAAPSVAKRAVDVVSTSNLTLSGEQTIDGVLTSSSRILVAGQTTTSDNGIYVTGAGAWTRSTDADTSAEVIPGMLVFVRYGDANSFTLWQLLDPGSTIILGSSALDFRQVDEWARENFTLAGGDITNQYITLAHKADINSIDFYVDGGGLQRYGVDYTHSLSSGVSRLTFAGDLATGGGAALIAGDVVRIKYIKRNE